MLRIIAASLLAVVCLDGISQNSKASKPLALFSIGKEAVSTDEFMYLYKKNYQAKEDFSQEKIEAYLALYIDFKLKVTEARQRGIDTTAAFLKEYTSYKEELKKPYLPEGKLIDSLVAITYKRLQEEVRVSHVLIGVKSDATPADTLVAYNKALEIKSRAQGGEDFGSLAALYSEEPMARTSKGDLGYFTAMQMVYPFENAAYTAKKGDIVGPVRTRFGYHILKIVDRKPSRGEVEVSHIMIRAGAERDAVKSKNLIFDIYDQLKGGVKWDELCKQYSEDPGSKNNGGKLRPFGVGAMATIPEFDRVAFSLQNPGDISDPFQTQFGWHIARLERKIPLPTFEEMASGLRGRVARDERTQISRQTLMQKLKREFLFNENAQVKAKVLSLADTLLTKGKWKMPVAHSLGKEKLFSLKSKNVLVQDFLQYIRLNQKPSPQTPQQYIEQLYNAFVEKSVNEALEAQIVQNHPEFELLLKEYYEGILLFDIMEKEVWRKASEDSLGQRKYFDSHAGKYTAGERVDAILYSSGTASSISTLKGFVEKGDTASVGKFIQSKGARQEAGVFQREDRPVLAKVEWKPGLYSIENNRMYYLVRILKMVPPGALTFEEARASVISDYQDSLEKEWLALLKKKYPVKVNAKAKNYVVEKLKT
jgi:peptidyl-prolyl cis-trans isomerase SurA